VAPDGYLPLVDLTGRLRDAHGLSIPYNVVWRAATEGRFPAIRKGSRWYVLEGNVPEIARTLKATAPTVPASAAQSV
jgi:hypothetical protein